MGAITGSDVAELSYHITQAGGMGVSDLALRPEVAKSHGHAHVRRTAGKFFPEPDVTYIDTPLFLKREVRRVNEKVPMMLPSTKLFELFVEKPEVMSKSAKRYELFNGLPCFEEHPVVLNARSQGIPVRPIALYWDGVSYYSVHDSFTGFFVTDLLSEQKFLSFLLRADDVSGGGGGPQEGQNSKPEQQNQKAPDEDKALDAGAEAAEGGESEEDEDAEY
ncbi:hypothetical protein AK812_SmicGene12804 [Symbiodinium microadriaticum]|uniref:Uncharacterized protein n=1 Tax=Symbiodinium microadriaticum TaxID=2951 RepID=A0A1Q9E9T8_SYMMI|nr:hypothetical protein AK812_SmicGene12804 [Symbiodinium microadriaticum]